MDTLKNTRAQMRKGLLELCLLSIADQQAVSPTDIISSLKDADLIVVEGTVYPLLSRLKRLGWVNSDWQTIDDKPARKYYTTTVEGRNALQELTNTWQQLETSISSIIKNPVLS